MKPFLLLLLTLACRWALADAGPDDVVRERVDLIELNHYYADDGRHKGDQVLFLDWCAAGPIWVDDPLYYTSSSGDFYSRWADGQFLTVWQPAVEIIEQEKLVERGGTFRIRAWRKFSAAGVPVRDFQSGGYVCRWHDDGALREVWADAYRETWTMYDAELEERGVWPPARRQLLPARK